MVRGLSVVPRCPAGTGVLDNSLESAGAPTLLAHSLLLGCGLCAGRGGRLMLLGL
jgi:hypothetical protein